MDKEQPKRPPAGLERASMRYINRHLRGTPQMQRELRRTESAHVFTDEATLQRVEQRLLQAGNFTGNIRGAERYGLLFDEVIGYRIDAEGNETPLYYGELKVKDGKYHANPRTKASR
ncbi:hypothetical protein [Phormidium sp. FACHB-1136]|uniref:DUF6972 family protein n=1 Tax=Phormidium sp. FACHB-1136 TaxID=2692848 RepID=UPI0018EFF772|nr:hypothetical protein [Phormidium sp. FACHB-1136]